MTRETLQASAPATEESPAPRIRRVLPRETADTLSGEFTGVAWAETSGFAALNLTELLEAASPVVGRAELRIDWRPVPATTRASGPWSIPALVEEAR